MNELQVLNHEQTISSREVAKMMEKEHWEVLRMIEGNKDVVGIIPTLNDINADVSEYFIKSTYKASNGKENKCYLITVKGIKLLYDNTKGIKKPILMEIYKAMGGKYTEDVIVWYRAEIEFIDQLEQTLEPFNIKGIQQYSVLNYRIDYYIPNLNIAIEYDENGHKNYTYEQHELRQLRIEKELGCKFIRVTDDNTHSYNVGLILKQIFEMNMLKGVM